MFKAYANAEGVLIKLSRLGVTTSRSARAIRGTTKVLGTKLRQQKQTKVCPGQQTILQHYEDGCGRASYYSSLVMLRGSDQCDIDTTSNY